MVTVRDEDSEVTEEDKQAVLDYAIESNYISINGTKVSSRAEKETMDWLLTHKINGRKIEVRYEPDVDDLFRPDFYFPQFEI